MDFTIKQLPFLYQALLQQGFSFITFLQYIQEERLDKFVILRHDVEQKYATALKFAKTQYELGIKGTYYFRILPKCFDERIVKQITVLGHEIGYHYDDLTYFKGDYQKAYKRFEHNLNLLRSIAPVKTICMDGSPLSKYDNKDLWSNKAVRDENMSNESHPSSLTAHFCYKDYNILGEPYFDTNFNEVFYLTDTGRRWDGWKVSVRDKVPQQEKWIKQGLVFHTTDDIIKAANASHLPEKIMFTFHPQRWNDKLVPWLKELVWQNVKNVGKRVLVRKT